MLGIDLRVNSPQLFADFLVTHLKPDIKYLSKKVGTLRFRSQVIELFPDEETPDIFEFTRNAQLKVVNSINTPLPSWFDKEEYLSKLEQKVRVYLEENSDVSDAIKQVEDRRIITDAESAKVFRDAIIILGNRMSEWYKLSYEKYSAKLLLISDISVDYFLLSKDAELAQIAAFDVYGKNIKDLDMRLGFDRPEKFMNDAKAFRSDLSPLVGLGRVLSDSLARLNLYLDLQNSSSLNEMFRLTPYRKDHIDYSVYEKYLGELEASLTDLSDELLARQCFDSSKLTLSESTLQLRRDLANVVLA